MFLSTQMLERSHPHFLLTQDQIQACLESYQQDVKMLSYRLASSGLSNTNYIVTLQPKRKLVLRIHRNDALKIGLKEYNLSKLLTIFSVIPQVFFFNSAKQYDFSYSIVEYKDGILLSDVMMQDNRDLQNVYFELGSNFAKFQKIKFGTAGILNENLEVIPIETKHLALHPVANFIVDCLENDLFKKRVDKISIGKIQDIIVSNESLLNETKQPPHLVHGDLKVENILVRQENKKIHLVGILDWEHARSDTTYGDIAILFRGDYDQDSLSKHAFSEGFKAEGAHLISSWDRVAKITDLINLCHFLCSKEQRPIFHETIIKHLNHTIQYIG